MPSTSQQRYVKEGEGWRLGWDGNAPHFQGLLGGGSWAIELTAAEFENFCRLAQQLEQTMQTMAAELMDEERLTCEAESSLLWLEAEGFPNAYTLRIILHEGRRCEGQWEVAATSQLLAAISHLTLF
jgi:hypothetical protein